MGPVLAPTGLSVALDRVAVTSVETEAQRGRVSWAELDNPEEAELGPVPLTPTQYLTCTGSSETRATKQLGQELGGARRGGRDCECVFRVTLLVPDLTDLIPGDPPHHFTDK